MRPMFDRTVTVLLAAAVVVGGLELTSYAANGHAFTLGQRNAESRPTTLVTSGRGPALRLRSRAGAPSLTVSSSRLVPDLNAAQVGGRTAAELRTNARTWLLPGGSATSFRLDGVGRGTYLATFDVSMFATKKTNCQLADGPTTWVIAVGAVYGSTGSVAAASGVLKHRSRRNLTLKCVGATGITSAPLSRVTLVRLDRVTRHGTTALARRP